MLNNYTEKTIKSYILTKGKLHNGKKTWKIHEELHAGGYKLE